MPYDYSKIKKWTAGAPDELKVGMVLDAVFGFRLIGNYGINGSGAWHSGQYVIAAEDIIRWAWLPCFEPEGE